MERAQLLRLRESLAALRVAQNGSRPVCVRLDAGTVVRLAGDMPASGFVSVTSETGQFTVFAEDLRVKSEPVLTLAAAGD